MPQLISASEIRTKTGLSAGVLVTHRKHKTGPKWTRIGREFFYEASALQFFMQATDLIEGDMTEKAAAKFLGLGLVVMKRIRRENLGPKHRRVGNAIIYNTRDMEVWLKHRLESAGQ